MADVVHKVPRGLRPSQPPGCPDGLFAVMQRCWAAEAKGRAAFPALEEQLRALAAKLDTGAHDSDVVSSVPLAGVQSPRGRVMVRGSFFFFYTG